MSHELACPACGDPTGLADAPAAAANAHLREIGAADPALAGLGTTLTAMLWSGTRGGPVPHRGLPRLSAPQRRAPPGHPTLT